MLAIASLATGFVVAAITPSHALAEDLERPDVDKTLSTVDHTVADESLEGLDGTALGQGG